MWITIIQFFASLSILVVLHECGHFFTAKWFKTKVEKFYLFFNPYFSLFKIQRGETEYGIGWLPLGGYVKIAGMIDESFDKEQMAGPPQPWEFRSKPAWQRLIIMLGGVIVNFILGIFLFFMLLWVFGESYIPTAQLKEGVAVDKIAEDMGLRDGDMILKIGDRDFDKFRPGLITREIAINNAANILVKRDGQEKMIPIDPKFVEELTKHSNKNAQLVMLKHPASIESFDETSPAKAKTAGFKVNDRIIAVNGMSTPDYHMVLENVFKAEGDNISLDVLRGQDTVAISYLTLFPKKQSIVQKILNKPVETKRRIGFNLHPTSHFFEVEKEEYGLGAAAVGGWNKSMNFLSTQIKAFGQMFRGKIKAKDSLGSFITIGKMFGTDWDWERFWTMTASLSLLLGFLNLLPIPALDGGHVVFLLFEVFTGIKPSDKVIEYSTLAGFILLVILMIYALGLDISRVI